MKIMELGLPNGVIVAMIRRGGENIVPRGDLILLEGDHVILYSQERISHASTIQI
jgi:Trk K+ transport system NAD-binding subunit